MVEVKLKKPLNLPPVGTVAITEEVNLKALIEYRFQRLINKANYNTSLFYVQFNQTNS